jgi:AhpD family alkylhydroperoxidase
VTNEEIAMTETMTAPAPRLKNPAMLVPGAMEAIMNLAAITRQTNLPAATVQLVHLRASQINGCSACVEFGWREARKSGVTDERLFAVSAWRESPRFTGAERAALALAEVVTRLADRGDAVPDEIWDEAARHYDDEGLASLVLVIGVTNLFNRLNATTRQTAGAWG